MQVQILIITNIFYHLRMLFIKKFSTDLWYLSICKTRIIWKIICLLHNESHGLILNIIIEKTSLKTS